MTDLIKEYVEAVKTERKAIAATYAAEEAADLTPVPSKLRPAEASDITEGAIIWYPEWKDNAPEQRAWNIVSEVLRPNDQFKAYCAHEGCRYGLDGAFVESK